jgi:hypothetical protein
LREGGAHNSYAAGHLCFSCLSRSCTAVAVTAALQIDQAALTGESLPVKKGTGDVAFSGSTIKQGERHALVYATGRAWVACQAVTRLLLSGGCTMERFCENRSVLRVQCGVHTGHADPVMGSE